MSIGRQQQESTIVDDFGVPHRYTLIPHPAGEGFDLMPVVVDVFASSLGDILDALDLGNLGEMNNATAELASAGDMSEEDVLGNAATMGGLGDILDLKMDGSKLGAAIAKFCQKLMQQGGTVLAKRLLKYTTRYSEDGVSGQKVSQHFDTIYQANYGELGKALWFVITCNWGGVLQRLPFVNAG